MNYYTIQPALELAPYVRFFWVYEGNDCKQPYIYRSLADSCCELVFHYKGIFNDLPAAGEKQYNSPRALLHAQASIHQRFITTEAFGIFGAYLYPFAIPALLQIASSDVSNQLLSLENLMGTEGGEIEERVISASDNYTRAHILSEYLLQRVRKSKVKSQTVQAAISYAIHSRGSLKVRDLAEKFNLSERQFERKFKEHSGFSPKTYFRIVRFHQTLKDYGNKFKSLTDIAYSSGYYDQSHFIHDFKQFSGYHPSFYFSGGAEGSEYREV